MYAMNDHHLGGGGGDLPRHDAARDRTALALERGRDLQAGAVNPFLRNVVAGTLSLVRAAVVRPLQRFGRRRASSWSLLALNDRMLADIGLRRGDLQGRAYGVIPVEQIAAPGPRAAELVADVTILRPKQAPSREPPTSLDPAA